MQFTPIDFPVGWRQLYPCGKSLAYLPRLQGSRRTDRVFSWPRFRVIQVWQVWAGYLTEVKHRGAAKSRRGVSVKSVLRSGQRCPAVRGQRFWWNNQGSTINTKPNELDCHREQVALRDKERESKRKRQERRQMAEELNLSVLSSTGGERRTQQRRLCTTLTGLKEIHFNLASQSRTHKTVIAVENELISNMFSLDPHRTSERGKLL